MWPQRGHSQGQGAGRNGGHRSLTAEPVGNREAGGRLAAATHPAATSERGGQGAAAPVRLSEVSAQEGPDWPSSDHVPTPEPIG